MKNRLIKRISAIIICACLLISVVSVVGAAKSAVPTAEVAAGEGNYLINGGFEADSALLAQSGEITLGWKLNNTKAVTPSLSKDSYEGGQALKIDLAAADAMFTLTPSIADDNGKITDLKAGIYNLSFYVKGNAALSVNYLDVDLNECSEIFNPNSADIIEWTLIKVPMGLGSNGWIQFTITPVNGTATAAQSVYIDNVSLRLVPSVINGEFESEVTVPKVTDSLIADGNFENGTINALSTSGDTVSILKSQNGYGLKAYSYSGFFAEANTDTQFVHSGTRSLKLYTNTSKSKQYISIAPEGATAKHGTKDVYFFQNLESGTYTIEAYVKLPANFDSDTANDTRVLMRTFDWSTGNAVDTLNQNSLTPDINGWYYYGIEATVGEDGYLGFSIYIDPTGANANSTVLREIYIDDISIKRKPDEPKQEEETSKALITNGDFEDGELTADSKLKNDPFKFYDGGKWQYSINTDATNTYSGSRSLTVYGNSATNKGYGFITTVDGYKTEATTGNRYYENVESGTYILSFAFKETPSASTMVYLRTYDWAKEATASSAKGAYDVNERIDNSYTPDSNGWIYIEKEIVIDSADSGHLGFHIYVSDFTESTPIYFDKISLTKKEQINLVTNGDFEEGTVYSGVYAKAEGSTKHKIFVDDDGTTQLDSGYHFVAVNSSSKNVKYAIDTANVSSGTRSLKIYNSNSDSDRAGATITAEGASTHKNGHHYFSGLAAGKYTLSLSFKEARNENDNGRVHIMSYDYSTDTRVVFDRVDKDTTVYPADSNGWKHYTKELTVGADGYLNFEILVDSLTVDDYTYLDNISLIGDAPQSVAPPTPTEKDTDIPYWTTMADDAGKSALSIVRDDTVSGSTALKITQGNSESITILPKIARNSIGTGYNMLAFFAKGSGSIKLNIQTASDEFEEDITLSDSWNMYRVRDIEIKESETVKKISFTVTGTALLDAVQFYAQAGPALLTENFTLTGGSRSLCMPTVADGYKVTVKSSSNTAVIGLDGKITQPDYNTAVEVILSATNINDATDTADSHIFTVNVAGKYGDMPKASYKQMTLTDAQTGVSVTAVMNPDSKFRAMAVESDNKYYNEMLSEDMKSIAFYNTVLTPRGEHSSKLKFSFPVDSKYNGKTITVAYKGDGLDVEYFEVKAENGFVLVETEEDGFFMLQIPDKKASIAPSAGTTQKPTDIPADAPTEGNPSIEKQPEKQPTVEVEKADKKVSISKLIDNTLIWIVIIIAVAAILILIEITSTLLVKRKIKRS